MEINKFSVDDPEAAPRLVDLLALHAGIERAILAHDSAALAVRCFAAVDALRHTHVMEAVDCYICDYGTSPEAMVYLTHDEILPGLKFYILAHAQRWDDLGEPDMLTIAENQLYPPEPTLSETDFHAAAAAAAAATIAKEAA